LQKARVQYGQPDRCDYCEYPDMASAQWKWPDGASVKVEGGGMLNVFTAEGLKARQSWIARGEGNGGHASIGGGSAVVSAPHASEPTSETKQMTEKSAHPRPPQSALQHYYGAARRRVKRWFGW